MAVIYRLSKAPIDFMPSYCRVATYNEASNINLPLASIELLSLQQDANQTERIGRAESAPDLELLVDNTQQESANNDTIGREIPGAGSGHPPRVLMELPVARVPPGRPAKNRKNHSGTTNQAFPG